MNAETNFLGTGWGFPPSFENLSEGVEMVSGERDIKQSLIILLNTSLGERIMKPEYGCGIRNFVFQETDNSHIHVLKDIITNAILNYEPRVKVEEINIDTENYLDGVITIEIDYFIITTNTRSNIVFPYYLSEGNLVDM
jgi:phage baseplate assembly protein W